MNLAVRDSARRVLENNNQRSGDRSYFAAAYPRYPLQYYWDSCVQSLVMSIDDGRRAEEEMYTLLSTQFTDGCIPYLTSWGKPPFIWGAMLRSGIRCEELRHGDGGSCYPLPGQGPVKTVQGGKAGT